MLLTVLVSGYHNNSGVTGLVMSLEFTRKKRFKLKKIARPIYIRNILSNKYLSLLYALLASSY